MSHAKSKPFFAVELDQMIEQQRIRALTAQHEDTKPLNTAYWDGFLQCLKWLEGKVDARRGAE